VNYRVNGKPFLGCRFILKPRGDGELVTTAEPYECLRWALPAPMPSAFDPTARIASMNLETIALQAHRVAWPGNKTGEIIYTETREELEALMAILNLVNEVLRWVLW
jgi:hypothetical protein